MVTVFDVARSKPPLAPCTPRCEPAHLERTPLTGAGISPGRVVSFVCRACGTLYHGDDLLPCDLANTPEDRLRRVLPAPCADGSCPLPGPNAGTYVCVFCGTLWRHGWYVSGLNSPEDRLGRLSREARRGEVAL